MHVDDSTTRSSLVEEHVDKGSPLHMHDHNPEITARSTLNLELCCPQQSTLIPSSKVPTDTEVSSVKGVLCI